MSQLAQRADSPAVLPTRPPQALRGWDGAHSPRGRPSPPHPPVQVPSSSGNAHTHLEVTLVRLGIIGASRGLGGGHLKSPSHKGFTLTVFAGGQKDGWQAAVCGGPKSLPVPVCEHAVQHFRCRCRNTRRDVV